MPYWYFVWLLLTFWHPRPVVYVAPVPMYETWVPYAPPAAAVVLPPCRVISPTLSVCA